MSHPPYFLNVEPTSVCNLRCTICSMDGSRDPGYMDTGLYRKIIDDARAEGVTEVRLFLGGEPLLHREIAEFVRYAANAGLVTNIHTNATLLTREMSGALMDAGLAMLTFSFDGETPEEYGSIRVGGDFGKVLGNIIGFLEMKHNRNAVLPETTMQVIKPLAVPDGSVPPLSDEFRNRFRGLPLDSWLVIPPHSWAGELNGIGEEPPGKVYFPCQLPWQSMSVAWDGRVVACCGDLNGRIILGDLGTQTLSEVWNGDAMIRMRSQLLWSDTPKCSLCGSCTFPWRDRHPFLQELREFLGMGRG